MSIRFEEYKVLTAFRGETFDRQSDLSLNDYLAGTKLSLRSRKSYGKLHLHLAEGDDYTADAVLSPDFHLEIILRQFKQIPEYSSLNEKGD
jgi:hypothetical protein